MDVGELRDRVSDLVIDCALADLPTFNVSDGNTQGDCNAGRRQHFVAIRDQQQDVWSPGRKRICKGQDRDTDCLRHSGIGI